MHREQTQPYRSTRFCFFFSRRRDRQLVCRSYVHSELVSFRVSTHACPGGTSPQVYLNGYMGVQVSRRTRMQIGSQLIQGRNNDNPPCSLPTIKRIFISPLLDPRYLAAFRKNSTTTSHLLPSLYRYSRASASETFSLRSHSRRVRARGFEVELSVSSVLERNGIGSQGQDQCIDKTTALQLAVHAATLTHIYTCKTHVHTCRTIRVSGAQTHHALRRSVLQTSARFSFILRTTS